jgi:hypothetical protein
LQITDGIRLFKEAVDVANEFSETKLKDLIKSLGGRVTSTRKPKVSTSGDVDAKAEQRAIMLAKAIDLLRVRYKNDFKEIVTFLEKESKGKKSSSRGFGTVAGKE